MTTYTDSNIIQTLGKPLGEFPAKLKDSGNHIEVVKDLLAGSDFVHFNLWQTSDGTYTVFGCSLEDVRSYAR